MTATAVFLPRRENFLAACREAMSVPHVSPSLGLYTDGERMARLPRPIGNFVRVAVRVKTLEDAYEDVEKGEWVCAV